MLGAMVFLYFTKIMHNIFSLAEHHRTDKKMLPTSVSHLPKQAMQTPPSPMAKGPPQVRNLPSGAQAAVSDNAPTTPPVTAAARRTKGPPSNIIGAMRVPIKALWPAKFIYCSNVNTTIYN